MVSSFSALFPILLIQLIKKRALALLYKQTRTAKKALSARRGSASSQPWAAGEVELGLHGPGRGRHFLEPHERDGDLFTGSHVERASPGWREKRVVN